MGFTGSGSIYSSFNSHQVVLSHELGSSQVMGASTNSFSRARRLIIIGYSMPPEDHVASGMIIEALTGRTVEVIIVDPCVEQVKDRLTRFGLGSAVELCFDGFDCVKDFAQWYRDEQAKQVVESLRTWAEKELDPRGARSTNIEPEKHTLGPEGEVKVAGVTPMACKGLTRREVLPPLLISLISKCHPTVTYRYSSLKSLHRGLTSPISQPYCRASQRPKTCNNSSCTRIRTSRSWTVVLVCP
jgi:hypothetical protein